jgi:23S rRNA (uracil1939-C5)-methyltransferase
VPQPGQQIELAPHAMSYRGTAVARLNGQAVFVSGALPGEAVVAEVQREHRDYLEAQVVEVCTPSPARVAPRCGHFADAGSCEWEFIEYDEQLRLKDEILAGQLRRIGHFEDLPQRPAQPSPSAWGYRNHARFAVDAAGDPCYLRRGSQIPVYVEGCAVLAEPINAIVGRVAGRLAGLSSLELRCGINSGELLIAPSLKGRGLDLDSGQASYHETLLDRRFRVSAGSFFQVNTQAAALLATLLIDSLALDGSELVADCYAGVGTFACLLAPHAKAVLAIESEVCAVEDGRLNAGFLENVRFRKGVVEQILPHLAPAPSVVVLDPPRAGVGRATIRALIEGHPGRVAYCSCDPATLARDLRLLVDGGFELESVQLVDMFPQTPHIEALAMLRRPAL